MTERPTPYDAPELYDLLLGGLDFDIPFWVRTGREAGGPVLDLGCGTGRVLLPLLEAGVDADGVDSSEAMLGLARRKAEAKGFRPRLSAADMRDFKLRRRYARILLAFNTFAHADTTEDQLATLGRCRAHLRPGGAVVVHMSYPGHGYWAEADGKPVMEVETVRAADGRRFQMWDTRTMDVVGQRQRSEIEIRELAADGTPVASHRFRTSQRWVYRFELELLFRLAGFARSEVFGGFAGEPLERDDQQMVAWAWRA
ncbi:MAG TPA: class I SAM-dependent methyltransferase [Burkholderiales bacterium]|nr:class I SAM-dependent methyltransferase [Burkholderiales bacterium]